MNRKEAGERESVGDFYRVIIENNLFRPLGWQRPNRDPEYALVATWIGTKGTVAKAPRDGTQIQPTLLCSQR